MGREKINLKVITIIFSIMWAHNGFILLIFSCYINQYTLICIKWLYFIIALKKKYLETLVRSRLA